MAGGRILVVDDRENWRSLFRGILQEEGYEVEIAESYAEAIRALQRTTFDLAVVDVRLIDADNTNTEGLALTAAIEESHWPTAVILVTGYGRASYHADPLLKKPRIKALLSKREFDNNQFLRLVAESAVSDRYPRNTHRW